MYLKSALVVWPAIDANYFIRNAFLFMALGLQRNCVRVYYETFNHKMKPMML